MMMRDLRIPPSAKQPKKPWTKKGLLLLWSVPVVLISGLSFVPKCSDDPVCLANRMAYEDKLFDERVAQRKAKEQKVAAEKAAKEREKTKYGLTNDMKECLINSAAITTFGPHLHRTNGSQQGREILNRCDVKWSEEGLAIEFLADTFGKKG